MSLLASRSLSAANNFGAKLTNHNYPPHRDNGKAPGPLTPRENSERVGRLLKAGGTQALLFVSGTPEYSTR